MRVQILQHVVFESPGLLVDEIRRKGYSLRTTALYNDDPMPKVTDFDILIIMGGSMSVHDEAEFPWLRAEKELIAAAIGEEKKVLGICLGAQLIAVACGARVYLADEKEIGWWPVKWVGGKQTTEFHWHGETFDLPKGAERLASTETCINQAFRLGKNVLAVQFHPEVTEELIRAMVSNEGWELEGDAAARAPFIQSAPTILNETARDLPNWLKDWL